MSLSQQLDLCGAWQLGWGDGIRGTPALAERDVIDPARYVTAHVPGEIHLDLERLGLIDDVRLGFNALKARWVEETRWVYRREFDAPQAALDAAGAWLVFEGLDYAARVVLNGAEVGQHKSAMRPCRINVTSKLRPGRNVLAVHVESGIHEASADDKPLGKWQYSLDHRLTKRHWLRKVACQFGWDWSTRLLNVGMFKPARLEWTNVANVQQVSIATELSPDLRRGTVRARGVRRGAARGEG
jgi:beta-mannosidase